MSDKVRKVIEELIRKEAIVNTVVCTVESVDLEQLTCDCKPVDEGAEYFDVRLRASIDDSKGGFVVIPKTGSSVLVSVINGSEQIAFLSLVSEADEIWMKGSDYEGIVKAVELKQQLDKTNEVVNAIVESLNSWVVAPGDGGAVLKALFATNIVGKSVGDFSNIQNEKVKHGSI